MTELKIETHIKQFSEVVDRVLENGGSLLDNEATDTILAAIFFATKELDQIRVDLQHSCREFLDRQIVENDFFAIQEYLKVNPSLGIGYQDIACNQSGRVVRLCHRKGRVDSLAALEMLSELRYLSFSGTPVVDISLLSKLPSLKYLSINNDQFLDTRTFGAMLSLEHFDGSSSRIDDLSWVSGCPNIRYLNLAGSSIKSIDQLNTHNVLEDLDLSWTLTESISVLSGHPTIKKLYLESTYITDLSPLLSLPSLCEVCQLPPFLDRSIATETALAARSGAVRRAQAQRSQGGRTTPNGGRGGFGGRLTTCG